MFEGKNVYFIGMLLGELFFQVYVSGDIFIILFEIEILGFVVLEVMVFGVLVVCVRVGGILDIVNQDGVIGFLYIFGDVDDCVEKLRVFLIF